MVVGFLHALLAGRPFKIPGNQMIDFVVHDEGDSVGVVVVEGVKAGDAITGWAFGASIRSMGRCHLPKMCRVTRCRSAW